MKPPLVSMLLSPMPAPISGAPALDHVTFCAGLSAFKHAAVPTSLDHMPPTKRPKLSLQTSSLSTSYGLSASRGGASSEMMSSTTTPTTLNTLSNTFDLSIRPSPSSATASPVVAQSKTKSRCSSPRHRGVPYDLNLPFSLRSILKNSSIPREYRRGSITASASPRTARRMFFPPPKKVSFQSLDEVIETHTYIARHIDLSSSDENDAPEGSEDITDQALVRDDGSQMKLRSPSPPSPNEGERGRNLRSRATSRRRNKLKKRRWEWTLGDTFGQILPEQSRSQSEVTAQAPPEQNSVEPAASGVELQPGSESDGSSPSGSDLTDPKAST